MRPGMFVYDDEDSGQNKIRDEFIKWLDEQIEDNDRRMENALGPERESYYLGCATMATKIKEKYLSLINKQ